MASSPARWSGAPKTSRRSSPAPCRHWPQRNPRRWRSDGEGPALVLPTLNGDPVDLAGPSPSDRVLLFWNPGCEFCQRMVDDLRAWEAHRAPDAPALMLISAGDAGATRAHGTPAAVRMDTEGRIASPVTTGKDAVLGLLRATSPAASNGHR